MLLLPTSPLLTHLPLLLPPLSKVSDMLQGKVKLEWHAATGRLAAMGLPHHLSGAPWHFPSPPGCALHLGCSFWSAPHQDWPPRKMGWVVTLGLNLSVSYNLLHDGNAPDITCQDATIYIGHRDYVDSQIRFDVNSAALLVTETFNIQVHLWYSGAVVYYPSISFWCSPHSCIQHTFSELA